MSLKIITFGCRLNSYESEVIKNLLKDKIPKDKDMVLFNSCAVTAEAERQLRQAIRKTKKENPDVKLMGDKFLTPTNTLKIPPKDYIMPLPKPKND